MNMFESGNYDDFEILQAYEELLRIPLGEYRVYNYVYLVNTVALFGNPLLMNQMNQAILREVTGDSDASIKVWSSALKRTQLEY